MVVRFIRRVEAPVSAEIMFDLSRDIDLHVRSMSKSREKAVAGTTSGLIGPGESVTWRATHFGVPIRMTSRISGFERPRRFVDSQVKGPFASFRHEHRFIATATGCTMLDIVEFRAPFGPMGWIAERLVLGRTLRRLIDTRNQELLRAAAGLAR